MHFGSGLMMGDTWVACLLVITSVGQSMQVHDLNLLDDLNCSEFCDSIIHRRVKDSFPKAICDCSPENADSSLSKQLDDNGIYFEPVEDVYSMQQLEIRPFYILNPISSLNYRSPKKLKQRKLAHNNKHEKRTASIAEPPESNKQSIYLDVDIENPVETSLSSTQQKLSVGDPFTLLEKDFAECVELYTLVYSEMDNVAHHIKEKCSQPADIVRRSLQQIKRTWADPKASSVKSKKTYIRKDKTNLKPKLSFSTNVEKELLKSKTDYPNVFINYEGEINNPLNQVKTISNNRDVIRDEQFYNESKKSKKSRMKSDNTVSNNLVSDIRLGSIENFEIDYTTDEYFTSLSQYNNTLDYEDRSNKNQKIKNNDTEYGTEDLKGFHESNQNITNNHFTDRVAITEIYEYSDETTSLQPAGNLKSAKITTNGFSENTKLDVFHSNNQSTSNNLTMILESVNNKIEEIYSTEPYHQSDLKKSVPTNNSSQNETNIHYPNTKKSNENYDSNMGFAVLESIKNRSKLLQDNSKTITQIKYLTQTTISSLDEQNSLAPIINDDTYEMPTEDPSALLVSFSGINDINNKTTHSLNDKSQQLQGESTTAGDFDYFHDKIIPSVQNSSEFSNINSDQGSQHQTAYDIITNAEELSKDTTNKSLTSRFTAPEAGFVFKSDVTDTKLNNQPIFSSQIANSSLPNDNIQPTIINSLSEGNITKRERTDATYLDKKEGLRSHLNKSDIDEENTTQAMDFVYGETDRNRNDSEIQFFYPWTTDKQSSDNITVTENVKELRIDNNIPKQIYSDLLLDYLNEINISSAIDLKEKLNGSEGLLSEDSSTEFVKKETLKGNLVLIFDNSIVPAKFVQKDNGEISIGIDGEALCSKLVDANNNQSLLIKVMCNCILHKKCTNSQP